MSFKQIGYCLESQYSSGAALPPQMKTDIARAHTMGGGAACVRFDFVWGYTDTGNGYDWTQLDARVAECVAQGVKILGTMPMWAPTRFRNGHTDKWQNKSDAAVQSFLQFVGNCAARYPQVKRWELGNEPNITTFAENGADPVFHATVAAQQADLIRYVNNNATCCSPGLSPANTGGGNMAPLDWINAWWPIAGSHVQRMAQHSYSEYADLGQSWSTLTYLPAMHAIAKKPIWLTECNTANEVAGSVRGTKVPLILDYYKSLGYVERIFIYTMSENTNSEPQWGVYDSSGTARPLKAALDTWIASNL